MNDKKLDLNVSDPIKAVRVLELAAQEYRESAYELKSAWQDKNAGAVWRDFARILDKAAIQMLKAARKRIG